MTGQEAHKIIENVFESSYDSSKYENFVYEFLNLSLDNRCRNEVSIKNNYKKNGISEVFLLGKYKDITGKRLDILEVYLEKDSTFSARILQRNFILDYLKNNNVNYVLTSFVYKNNKDDWRFSLIKLDYEFKNENGNLKVEQKTLPAKRYSYLVGKNEKTHTAKAQMVNILKDEGGILIEDIEKAFSIDKVTKDFFEEYKNIFLDFNEEFEKNEVFKNEVIEIHGIKTPDFTKKLLGQIVFLYFLQKKGWLGVKNGEKWGEGDRNFLRNLFDKKYIEYNNFFNDILEPLFYDTLNRKDRNNNSIINDQSYSDYFKCKIPYLNGGLFNNEYDWHNTNFKIEDKLFENLLDIFDRYNFTVYESDPLEKEVAVDPEMLGKVFENLLEIKDRKSKGAFYTPREIVHYMCQESLINYLLNNSEYKEEQIRDLFIKKDSFLTDEEKEEIKNNKSFYNKEFAQKINDLLKNVKIVDPAVGSGAFPMGMLKEITSARYFLNTLFLNEKNKKDKILTEYDIKKETLENCIYGVDLEEGAVDIARLRFWLSLVVEHSIEEVEPLPNLDYKIMQGNSLLEDFEGIKLFDEKIATTLINNKKFIESLEYRQHILEKEYIKLNLENKLTEIKKYEISKELKKIKKQIDELKKSEENKRDIDGLFDAYNEVKQKMNKLKKLHKEFFEITDKVDKKNKKNEIEKLEWELISATLKEQNKLDAIKRLEVFKKSNIKPFFLWKLNFSDVFEQGGFDIVIGNPPYVQLQKFAHTQMQKDLENQKFKTFEKTGDLYTLFYEKGLELAKIDSGILCYITSNKWIRAGYGEKLREYFIEHNPVVLLDLGGGVFESATVDSNILLIQNTNNKGNTIALTIKDNKKDFKTQIKESGIVLNFNYNKGWFIGNNLEINLKKKIEQNGKPLKDWDVKINYGIKTGLNEAFIINKEIREKLIAEDPKSAEIIKPILRGRDIKRYYYEFNDVYMICTFPALHLDIENYKAIKRYLLDFGKDQLEQSGENLENGKKSRKKTGNKWFETQDQISYYEEFEKEKVVWGNISYNSCFSYVDGGIYVNAPANIITSEIFSIKYLIACMNSAVFNWEFKQSGIFLGKAYEWKKQYVENIHIPKITLDNKKYVQKIENLVDQILIIKKQNKDTNTKNLEEQIDKIVYKLYELTYDEVLIIDKDFSMTKEEYENFKVA